MSSDPDDPEMDGSLTGEVTGRTDPPDASFDAGDLATPADDAPGLPFPVVGVGSSAGGFEALSQLLEALPDTPDLALILVQHLDPEHRSQLAELLSGKNMMPVTQVEDGTPVEVDHVYVIPPGQDLAIQDGVLHLRGMEDTHGSTRTIDRFFTSLAEDQGPLAIGVLLSGTMMDGVAGLKQIRAAGGTTLAQEPDTAKYGDMPRAAIAANAVDFVLAPADLADELVRIRDHPTMTTAAEDAPDADGWGKGKLDTLFQLLKRVSPVDFRHYKQTTIKRRIHRRMLATRMRSLEEYIEHCQENPDELTELYNELLILVTRFFRDPEAFEALREETFPGLVERTEPGEQIRIWIAGCATGEEAYSVAIALDEYLDEEQVDREIQLFGTDISEPAIQTARDGVYPPSTEAEVSQARLQRYFEKIDGGYRINDAIRGKCVFAMHDLTSDPPFSDIDLVTCRNVLIYLESSLQERALTMFHYALGAGGFLFLGHSEMPGAAPDLFEPANQEHRIYQPRAVSRAMFPQGTPNAPTLTPKTRPAKTPPAGTGDEMSRQAQRTLLKRYAPPAALVGPDLEVVEFLGDTEPFLRVPDGRATYNLLQTLRDGLATPVGQAIEEAQNASKPVRSQSVRVASPGGDREVTIEVIPIPDLPNKDQRLLVVFLEPGETPRGERPPEQASVSERLWPVIRSILPAPTQDGRDEVEELKRELNATRDYLQSVIEEYEATTEELRSANEEALSANEELQSTNEELETAREELQATNEELVTLNDELKARNEEIQKVNDDLVNLLHSVRIPILMLGPDLRIRRFTPDAEELMNLIPTDMGRPITDLNLPFDEREVENLALQVLDTLKVEQVQMEDKDGNAYTLKVRPYRTSEDRIDGIVLVFLQGHRPHNGSPQAEET